MPTSHTQMPVLQVFPIRTIIRAVDDSCFWHSHSVVKEKLPYQPLLHYASSYSSQPAY